MMAKINKTKQPRGTKIRPRRGRYWKRVKAYAAAVPSSRANTALVVATMTVLMYGRIVSRLKSPTST
jgi:hypothetical protein